MTLDQPTERQPPLKCVVLNVEYCWLSLGYGKPTLQQVSSCILSLSTQQQVSLTYLRWSRLSHLINVLHVQLLGTRLMQQLLQQ